MPSVIDGPAGAGSASEAGPGGETGSGSERRAYDVATADHPRVPRHLHQQIWSDLRWSFRPPWVWLSGIVFNLVLSLLYLIVDPLSDGPHRNWAILVGSYFAVFVLADVTTTNVLGADAQQVRAQLADGTPLHRILVRKNLILFLVVGLPILALTAILTVCLESSSLLVLTLPGVLFPILVWFGLGNVVSVALPVAAAPLRQRWSDRHDRRRTVRWIAALALPYGLCFLIDPISDLPMITLKALGVSATSIGVTGLVLVLCGTALYLAGSAAAVALARPRRVMLAG